MSCLGKANHDSPHFLHIPMTATIDNVVAQLFDERSSSLDAWVKQTQLRADAFDNTRAISPLKYSPDHPTNKNQVLETLCTTVKHHGFALYSWIEENTEITVSNLLHQLSLGDGDSGVIREAGALSLLQDLSGTPKGRFPPYQSKTMNWHTDGYYNGLDESVRCFTLHCVEPATTGGDLLIMDDNFLVLALLQDDPAQVALLSHPEAMTLPANKDAVGHDRPDRKVPMIQQHPDGAISMRFTTRARNIHWRCKDTQAAAEKAVELINQNSQWQVRVKLHRGEGIVTRNILHAREAFHDMPGQPKRQILRGRFHNLPAPVGNTTHNSKNQESTCCT